MTDAHKSLELMAPALLSFLVTKNLNTAQKGLTALGSFGVPIFGKTYKEHKDAGAPDDEALSLAKKAVVWETVPELLMWGPMRLAKTPIMALMASAPVEGVSEMITELLYIQDEIRNQGKTMSPEEIVARVKHAWKMGFTMGPMIGGAMMAPQMYDAIAKGKPEQVIKILRKHKAKMAAEGNTDVKVTILIDAAIEKLGDSTLSPEEHARALATFMNPESQGGIFERSGG